MFYSRISFVTLNNSVSPVGHLAVNVVRRRRVVDRSLSSMVSHAHSLCIERLKPAWCAAICKDKLQINHNEAGCRGSIIINRGTDGCSIHQQSRQ